jgi:uncharacterized membrane protein HdeD (DUF308 family)
MLEKITHNWWLYALRGLVAVLFGILAFTRPEQALHTLVLLFGAYALVDGILAIVAGIASKRYFERWWAVLLEGVAGVVIGLLTFFLPGITTLALLYFIGAWALITGILEIVAAIQLRRVIKDEWMLILGGLFSILFSVLMFVFPVTGAVSVIWVIGIYAVFFGISEIIFAFRLHSLRRDFEKAVTTGI